MMSLSVYRQSLLSVAACCLATAGLAGCGDDGGSSPRGDAAVDAADLTDADAAVLDLGGPDATEPDVADPDASQPDGSPDLPDVGSSDVADDACTNDCTLPTCGNGVVESGEACDDDNDDETDDCLSTCMAASCGDGFVQAGVEDCDDMGESATCDVDCTPASCGDGVTNASADESCDDQNDVDDDACSNACIAATCSDGVLNQGEVVVDCEGPCPGCDAEGASCATSASCASGHCSYEGRCAPLPVSCLDLLFAGTTTNGVYRIDPDGDGLGEEVYCDMSTDGGGWTLVASTYATTSITALRDQASGYYTDLATVDPAAGHTGVWEGLRPIIPISSDLRFTCKADPATLGETYDVDLSFYDVQWYLEITTGSDADSCFEEGDGVGYSGPRLRRDNLTGQLGDATDPYAAGYMEGEDSCGDAGDFTVDFEDRGMDGDQSDGTDWGLDDNQLKCGTSGLGDGVWHVWTRENTCFDGVKNRDEFLLDCGGSCGGCADGAACLDDAGCVSGLCRDEVCAPSHCTNGERDGDEAGVDCGGGSCLKCGTGGGCVAHADCASGSCNASGVCEAPASSCLALLARTPGLPDGVYSILPGGLVADFEVWCDMTSDGGGYTLLKIDPGATVDAVQAEFACDAYGMNLLVTRSQAHARAAVALARDPEVGPDASDDYVRLLGIYPRSTGASCPNKGFNSVDCRDAEGELWRSNDGHDYWVGEREDIAQPSGDNDFYQSMSYSWDAAGDIGEYDDLPEPDTSTRFICHHGDKLP